MTDEKVEITQKASASSQPTMIGVQNNYTGLSPTEAAKMAVEAAIAMFREYFPRLREEALQDVRSIVIEKLASIPPERIVSPSARLVVPALQNASITEEPELRRMYAYLLANSMDNVVRKGVHPSFVEIINQLSPDEAKVLTYLSAKNTIPIISLRYENDKEEGADVIRDFSDIGERTKCEQPLNITRYFDNLKRLGLIDHAPELSALTKKELYEPLKNHRHIKALTEQAHLQKEYSNSKITESYYYLTDFGKSFCEMCVIDLVVIALPKIS